MLGKQDGANDLFNGYVEQRLLPKKHELLEIDAKIDFSFVEEEAGDLYCRDNGRPSYPPQQMFRILFLEYYYNLSDVEVIKQLQVNILFRRFVGLSLEDTVPDDSSLCVFRVRLGEDHFQRLFSRLTEQCRKQGLIGDRLKVIDATHVVADIAVPNMINMLRDGRHRILKKIEQQCDLEEDLKRFCPNNGECHRYSKEQLVEEVQQTREFLNLIEDGCEVAEQERKLLREAIDPNRKRTLASFVDPDARAGHTSSRNLFVGYKVHLSQDSSSQLVTTLDVLPGNANEGKVDHTNRLLNADQQQGVHHRAVVADSLCDNRKNYDVIWNQQMKAYIPSRRKDRRADNFHYEPQTDQLICPQGSHSIGKLHRSDGDIYRFSVTDCRRCSLTGCNKGVNGQVSIYLSAGEKARRTIPACEMAQLMNERRKVERKFGQAKRHHELSRTRYRCRWRMAIQALMTFFVINAKRMIKLLTEKSKEPSPVLI